MRSTFAAPWATSLKVISILTTVLILAMVWMVTISGSDEIGWGIRVGVGTLPPLILGTCALFTVRGYEVADGEMKVQRLLWRTRIPLQNLTDAEWRPGSFGWVWRTFGNGGLYSFSGWFYQKSIGAFRALATRTSDAVILSFSDRKPIVVTPDDSEGFVVAIKGLRSKGSGCGT